MLSEPCGTNPKPPARYKHVVWIVMENKGYSDVIGSSIAPYINSVAQQCGVATNFYAESSPSLPNYIAMTSGSTQGISDDDDPSSHRLAAPSIFSQVGGQRRALEESPCPLVAGSRTQAYTQFATTPPRTTRGSADNA